MHAGYNKFCFNSQCSEPIILSGRIFSLRLLSAYDFIVFMKRHNRLLKFLSSSGNYFSLCKSIAEKACLVSMCLYIPSTNSRLFPNALVTLKSLTPFELKYVYNRYLRLNSKTLNYNVKMVDIFERVKKHGYQQTLQESKI